MSKKLAETLVITRPREDAKKLAARLKEKDFNCIIEPVLSIKTLHRNAPALERALQHKPQAILVTSKHAISAFATMTKNHNFPLICVGQITAEHARKLGFKNITSANGTAKALITYTEKHYLPARGPMLYIRGQDISTDIAGRLEESGFMVESVILYKAVQAKKLSKRLCKAIIDNKVNAIAFYSENTARTYAQLTTDAELEKPHQHITALCMSKAIADTTKKMLKWKKVTLFPVYLKV